MSVPRYASTRGTGAAEVPFAEALLRGLAPDGGLYVPTSIPPVPEDAWTSIRFPELAARVLSRWIDDLDDLPSLLAEALDFPIPVVPLERERYVLELFHGPTLSFKDVGARTMARLMGRYLARQGRRLTILVATSGDTGSAVADGFAGQPALDVVLLYPKGLVSPLQERQLIVRRPGVRTFAVDGTFDDCQRLVKAAFVDPALEGAGLSSANSINIGRLLPQTLYYLWGALEVARQRGERRAGPPPEITVCVPSGNLGNLTGGLLAERMGLPVQRFVAAHNANDYFPAFLRERAEPFAFRPTVATLSNAMDVGAPSNFERIYALLGARAPERIHAESVDDAATRARLERVYHEDGYLACPHTAVGLEALERYRERSGDRRPALILATAHPAKFPEVIQSTLGEPPPTSPRLDALAERPTAVRRLAPTVDALRDALLETR